MRARHRVVVSLLLALALGAGVVPAAGAEGPHRTSISVRCVATAFEPAETLQSCEAVVEDGSSEPRIAAAPAKRTHQRVARFRFEGDTNFECALDGGPYRPCGAVFRQRVAAGAQVLRVRPAGGGPVASFRWRVLGRR
jgi:hypothetical protein